MPGCGGNNTAVWRPLGEEEEAGMNEGDAARGQKEELK